MGAGTAAARADDAKQLFFEGFELLKAGKAKAAAAKFEQGLKQEPNNAEAHFYLGEAYRARKQVNKARQHYEASLTADANSTVAAQVRERLAAFTAEATPPKKNPGTVKDPIIKDEQGNITNITGWHVLRFGMTADEVSQALGLPVNLERLINPINNEDWGWSASYEEYDVGGIKAKLRLEFSPATQSLMQISLDFPYSKQLEEHLVSEMKSQYGSNPEPADLRNHERVLTEQCQCDIVGLLRLDWKFSDTIVRIGSFPPLPCNGNENFCRRNYDTYIFIKYVTRSDSALGKIKPKL